MGEVLVRHGWVDYAVIQRAAEQQAAEPTSEGRTASTAARLAGATGGEGAV